MITRAEQYGNVRRLDLTGAERRLGRSVQVLGRVAERFASSARRCMPFLTRRRGRVVTHEVSVAVPPGASESSGPRYRVELRPPEGPLWAALELDTGAIAILLDGMLGASGGEDRESSFGIELTAAQKAVLARGMQAVAREFAAAISFVIGSDFAVGSARPLRTGESVELPRDALRVEASFDGLPTEGVISLYMGAEALQTVSDDDAEEEPDGIDPRMAQALSEVNVELIAELGFVELSLGRILSLQPGETLRLSTPVDDPILVRIAGETKFDATPVISRGQMAVQIQGRRRK